MAETKSFREAMKENNAKFKDDWKASNEKIKADSRAREERAEVKRIAKAKMNTERFQKDDQEVQKEQTVTKLPKEKGPNGFMVLLEALWMLPMALFSLLVIVGVGAFVVTLIWKSIFG